MAMTSFPFDGQDTTEDQYSRLFSELQSTGVASSATATDLGVTADGSTLVVSVAAGFAYMRGHGFQSTAVEQLTMPVPSSGTATHRVILRLDPAANAITLEVLAGTAGLGAPDLTQDPTGIFEFSLARVQVGSGTTALTNADIVDERQFVGNQMGAWSGAAGRPTAPRAGETGFNMTDRIFEFWNGTGWEQMSNVPTGSILMDVGPDVPLGYLLCDGSLYNSTQYPRLAARVGTTFSVAGDAAGTFRTPNLTHAFPLGGGTSYPVGTEGGARGGADALGTVPHGSVRLDETHMPSHAHGIEHGHVTDLDGLHDHGYKYSSDDGSTDGTFRTGRHGTSQFRDGNTGSGITTSASEHQHNIAVTPGMASASAGGDAPVSVMPPFLSVNFIIKA